MEINSIYHGDCKEVMKTFSDESINCCVTSPPYWGLRDYGHDGQLGLEKTPEEYVKNMVEVFKEVKRVLRPDGTLWLNIGDSYAMSSIRGGNKEFSGNVGGHKGYEKGSVKLGSRKIPQGLKPKDLVGIPWRVAFALQADGWYLRQDIIWAKPNPMPESVTDRCTKSHEYIFLLSKSAKYYYDHESIKEKSKISNKWKEPDKKYLKNTFGNGETSLKKGFNRLGEIGKTRNRRDVWTVTTKPFKGAHFATFPPKLIEPCILAGCPAKVCDSCGLPWVRQVETIKTFQSGSGKSGNPIKGKQDLSASKTNSTPDIRKGPCVSTKTIGFTPTCKCNAGHKPAIVLDPFMGAGTVGWVASENNRNYIGCELNPEYIKIAEQRILNAQPQLF